MGHEQKSAKTFDSYLSQKTYSGPGLGKCVVGKTSHCDLQGADLLERDLFEDKEVRIPNVFQTYSPRRTSYAKTSQGGKYYPLTI